jgi:periplasmic copper chaperone A
MNMFAAKRMMAQISLTRISLASLMIGILLGSPGAKASDISVTMPFTRATPAGAKVAGGYMMLENRSKVADRLVGGTSEIAGRIEIHEMANVNGVMTMRELPKGLEIPAEGMVALKPGSYHVMLMGLRRQLKEGEKVSGTLVFEKAGTIPVTYEVRSIAAGHQRH